MAFSSFFHNKSFMAPSGARTGTFLGSHGIANGALASMWKDVNYHFSVKYDRKRKQFSG